MDQNGTVPAILALGTAVPGYFADQKTIGRWMAASFADRPAVGRWLRQLYAQSGIETRYSCAPEFLKPAAESRLAVPYSHFDRAERSGASGEIY